MIANENEQEEQEVPGSPADLKEDRAEGEMDDGQQPGDEQERAVFEQMVSALRDHIFGPAEASIRAKLRQSQDVHDDVGTMALALVMEAAKQAGQSGVEVDFDMLMSVGTEVIEDLLQIAEAMGLIKKVGEDDMMKATMSAVRGYLVSADVPPEEQEAAKQQLQQMQVDGDVQSVAGDIQRLGQKEGVDPFADGEQAAPSPQRPQLMGGAA